MHCLKLICEQYNSDCEGCPLNGKCVLVSPDTWDMEQYEIED